MIQKILKIANFQATKLYFYNTKMILLGETCYSFNNKTVILNNLLNGQIILLLFISEKSSLMSIFVRAPLEIRA